MAKDPAFLFYPGDWLGGTITFTRYHKGAYMDLLMTQFNVGHMSIEQIKTVLGDKDEYLWESVLKQKFKEDENGLFYNAKLEYEVLRRRNYTEGRRKNLAAEKSHMEPHMENGNENEINNENYKEIINYLNLKTGKSFKHNTTATQRLIRARMNESRTIEDFKKVIDVKTEKWINDDRMRPYLRPETLFGTKFESYLNEYVSTKAEWGEA